MRRKEKRQERALRRHALRSEGAPASSHSSSGATTTPSHAPTPSTPSYTSPDPEVPAAPEAAPSSQLSAEQLASLRDVFCRTKLPNGSANVVSGNLNSLFGRCHGLRNNTHILYSLSSNFVSMHNAKIKSVVADDFSNDSARSLAKQGLEMQFNFRKLFFETDRATNQMLKDGELEENYMSDKMSCQATESTPPIVTMQILHHTLSCELKKNDENSSHHCPETQIYLESGGEKTQLCAE